MKKIAFIGGYDKADIIIYVAKILSVLNKKVLIVDTTLIQKTKYIVPTMTPAAKYVTTYDGIDIAIGFEDMNDIQRYLSIPNFEEYDYIIFDIDNPDYYNSYGLTPEDEHCFLTTFDIYSVQKGINVLRTIKQTTNVLKALITRDPDSEESEYLDFVTFNLKIKWKENIVYIPFDTEDLYEIYQNQRYSRVKFSGLSMDYIDSLSFLIENLTTCTRGDIRKAIKIIERDA